MIPKLIVRGGPEVGFLLKGVDFSRGSLKVGWRYGISNNFTP